MRALTLILCLLTQPLFAEEHERAATEIPIAGLIERAKNAAPPATLEALGLNGVNSAHETSQQVDTVWLSKLTLERQKAGLFKILKTPDEQRFIAPQSTDIALIATLDLSSIPPLIESYFHILGDKASAERILNKQFGGQSLEQFLQSPTSTIQLVIDFDELDTLDLGKESIGYPHIAIQITGNHQTFESALKHFVSTRGALFTAVEEGHRTNYQLPEYFSEAISGYLPIISFDRKNDTTTLASSPAMLERCLDANDSLYQDPAFQQTWKQLPQQASIMGYISKRALNGFQHFYTMAMREQWTDNPTFLSNRFTISAAVAQLTSSESGLAFTLRSEQNSDTLTLKSGIPLSMLRWFLKN
jgi:hypothetical protein